MKTKVLVGIVIGVLVIAAIAYFLRGRMPFPSSQQGNGTTTSSGFPIPSGGPVPEGATVTVVTNLKHAGSAYRVEVTPEEVLEDSRCPVDGDCLRAGTVRIKVKLVDNGEAQQGNYPNVTSERELALGDSVQLSKSMLTFTAVDPEKRSGEENPLYRFAFTVTSPQ